VLAGAIMMLSSSSLGTVLGFVRGILVMRIIGPTGRGLVRTVDLLNKYLTHSHLGILHGMSKQLPMALGAGDRERATRIEDTGTTLVLLLGSLTSLALLLYTFIWSDWALYTRQTIGLGAAVILCGQALAAYQVMLRSWGRYKALAVSTVISTVGMFVLFVGAAHVFTVTTGNTAAGAAGVTWGWLVASLLVLYYLHRAVRFPLRLRIDWQLAKQLIVAGLPIALVMFTDNLLRSVDGLVVLRDWGVAGLGIYSVAMQVAAYLYRLPQVAGFVLSPRIWEQYGATSDVEAVRRYVITPTLAAAFVMPAAAGVAHVFIPAFVLTFIPKFAASIVPTQILALMSIFLALPVAANALLIALNRELAVAVYKTIGAAVVAVGVWLALHHVIHSPLRWVALATGLGWHWQRAWGTSYPACWHCWRYTGTTTKSR